MRSAWPLMFDLDGTLTDSRVGIARCLQHALAHARAPVPPVEELTRYIGPPLAGSFATLLGTRDAQTIDVAIGSYRERFEQVGMYENVLYPGVRDMLTAFQAGGHPMYVVTVKPRVYALRILEHFRMAQLFRRIHGPELSARDYSKALLIRDLALDASAETARIIVVGDRADDVDGARVNGLHSVAVTWGYGDRAELAAAQPDRIVASPAELVQYIRGVAGGRTCDDDEDGDDD